MGFEIAEQAKVEFEEVEQSKVIIHECNTSLHLKYPTVVKRKVVIIQTRQQRALQIV